jgi:hypothetical protein
MECEMVGRRTIQLFLVCGIAFACCPTATADEYPYSGYFQSHPEGTDPGFVQAKCALQFYEQKKDGSSVNYILDQARYKSTGEVRYRISHKFDCSFESKTKLSSCTVTNYDGADTYSYPSFDVLEPRTEHSFTVSYFRDVRHAILYLERQEHIEANQPLRRTPSTRCIGFTEDRIERFMTSETYSSNPDDPRITIHRKIEPDDISAVLDIMGKIGPKSLTATLPSL